MAANRRPANWRAGQSGTNFPAASQTQHTAYKPNLGEQDGRFVLRTQPAGLLLKSAHAVDREFRVMKALDKTAVPVPGMIAACDDPDVIGMKFFIMREIEGDT
jgi:aminoglycoside phosphotransferase (APT) family kinase protein